jgi:hypothetical protein
MHVELDRRMEIIAELTVATRHRDMTIEWSKVPSHCAKANTARARDLAYGALMTAVRSLTGLAVLSLTVPVACVPATPPPADDSEPDAAQDMPVEEPDGGTADAGLRDAGEDAAVPALPDNPMKLSETGLFEDMATEALAVGVMPYEPRYTLWSDGSTKRRWLYLPEGTQIDTSHMDAWQFPVGTRLWKEFSVDGVRVETRLLFKRTEGTRGWLMIAFGWNAEQTEAYALPDGQDDALGTGHDIPGKDACRDCHANVPDIGLGVSAMQLAYEGQGVTLAKLGEDGWLSTPPSLTVFDPPGDADTQAALGYLHANCGTCHNPDSSVFDRNELALQLSVDALASVQETPAYQTTVDISVAELTGSARLRVVSGDPEASAVYERMSTRGSEEAMPPLASKLVDPTGLELVAAWIRSLAE